MLFLSENFGPLGLAHTVIIILVEYRIFKLSWKVSCFHSRNCFKLSVSSVSFLVLARHLGRGRSWTAKLQLATICGFRDKPTCSWNKQTGRENCYKIQYKKAICDEVSSWLWFYRFPFTLKIWSKIKAIPPKSLYLQTNQTGWGLQKSLTPNPWTNGPLKNNNWQSRNLLRWRTLTWKWLYSCT